MLGFVWRYVVMPLIALFLGIHLAILGALLIWKTQPVHTSAFMLTHLAKGQSVHQVWIESSSIPLHVKQAAIVSEDAKFITHNGFDWEGIRHAQRINQSAGTSKAGGSTISQQLAKNLFLTSHRSYIRKGEEAIITLMLEGLWDKSRILTVYLNVAEFGQGIYGVEAAAQHFYSKHASELTRHEAANLIARLPRPKYYDLHPKDKRLARKTKIIKARMSSAQTPKESQ